MRNPEEDGKGNEEMKLLSDNILSAFISPNGIGGSIYHYQLTDLEK